MRALIILGQNLATLAFGNCRDLPYGLIFFFTQKVNCEKKIITSPRVIAVSGTNQECYNVTYYLIYAQLYVR